jgi:hypothetical protein
MALRDQLRRLQRDVRGAAVLIRLRDGTTQIFSDQEAYAEMFLCQLDLFSGEARPSEVLDAVRNATPESRREFEEEYGPITMTSTILASVEDGGWAEVFTLLEDGTVERVCHEGGSEEAERLRLEAQQQAQAGPMPSFS